MAEPIQPQPQPQPRFENEYVANLYQETIQFSKEELIQLAIRLQLSVNGLGKKNDELEEENKKLKTDLIKVPKGSMNYRYMREMEEENKKLKDEIEALKRWRVSKISK